MQKGRKKFWPRPNKRQSKYRALDSIFSKCNHSSLGSLARRRSISRVEDGSVQWSQRRCGESRTGERSKQNKVVRRGKSNKELKSFQVNSFKPIRGNQRKRIHSASETEKSRLPRLGRDKKCARISMCVAFATDWCYACISVPVSGSVCRNQ